MTTTKPQKPNSLGVSKVFCEIIGRSNQSLSITEREKRFESAKIFETGS